MLMLKQQKSSRVKLPLEEKDDRKSKKLLKLLTEGKEQFLSCLRDKLTDEKPWILVKHVHDYDSEPETQYFLLTEQQKQQVVESCAKQQTNQSYYSNYAEIGYRIYDITHSILHQDWSDITDTREDMRSFEPGVNQGSLISKDKILQLKENRLKEKGKPAKTIQYSYHYEENNEV